MPRDPRDPRESRGARPVPAREPRAAAHARFPPAAGDPGPGRGSRRIARRDRSVGGFPAARVRSRPIRPSPFREPVLAGGMREIVPGILTWPWFSERHGYDFNGWWILHPSGNVAVDPVEMPDDVLGRLARDGVARIVVTNRNHSRAAARLREATGARVAIHPADAPHASSQGLVVDEALEPGGRVGPFTAVDASGKSPGEVALHWPERRILVVGDACVGKPPGECALLPPGVIDDLPRLQASLRRLAALDVDALLLGDGAPILTGGAAALRRLVAGFGPPAAAPGTP